MKKRSKHMLKTVVALALVIGLALAIFFVVRNSKRTPQHFLTPEQEQRIIDLLNNRVEADPPTQADIDNLIERVKGNEAE